MLFLSLLPFFKGHLKSNPDLSWGHFLFAWFSQSSSPESMNPKYLSLLTFPFVASSFKSQVLFLLLSQAWNLVLFSLLHCSFHLPHHRTEHWWPFPVLILRTHSYFFHHSFDQSLLMSRDITVIAFQLTSWTPSFSTFSITLHNHLVNSLNYVFRMCVGGALLPLE